MATLPLAFSITQLHDEDEPKVPWSRTQTYNFINEGKLSPRYIGNKPIILACDIEQLILSLPKEKA